MNNVYSCRRIEKLLLRDIHYIWLAGYNLQIATENQFITNFALYPNPTDTLTFIPFEEMFFSRYGRFAKTAVADSGYGSEENYRFMDGNGTEAFVKYNYFHKEQKPRYKPNPFHPESLYYNVSSI